MKRLLMVLSVGFAMMVALVTISANSSTPSRHETDVGQCADAVCKAEAQSGVLPMQFTAIFKETPTYGFCEKFVNHNKDGPVANNAINYTAGILKSYFEYARGHTTIFLASSVRHNNIYYLNTIRSVQSSIISGVSSGGLPA